MNPFIIRVGLACTTALGLAGCAAPALHYFTLGAPDIGTSAQALPASAPVILVDRVVLPDYLDTQEITTREGSRILRSTRARWAERLSVSITSLMTARLGAAWPGFWVVAQGQDGVTPTERLAVTITRLDVTRDGQGVLEASWQSIPLDAHQPIRRGRGQFRASGSTADPAGAVSVTRDLVEALATRIARADTP